MTTGRATRPCRETFALPPDRQEASPGASASRLGTVLVEASEVTYHCCRARQEDISLWQAEVH